MKYKVELELLPHSSKLLEDVVEVTTVGGFLNIYLKDGTILTYPAHRVYDMKMEIQ